MALTDKQARFVQEYLVDCNATGAATRAGYSAKTAEQQGYQLLQIPSVKDAVQKAMDARSKRTGITADSVLSRLNSVADRCMQAEPVMVFDHVEKEMVQARDDEDRAVYQFDSGGANKALELIGKHLKLFTDKTELVITDALASRIARARERRKANP